MGEHGVKREGGRDRGSGGEGSRREGKEGEEGR